MREIVITEIRGYEPARPDSSPISYAVGVNLVTKITREGGRDDCDEMWFNVWAGERVVSSVNARAVAEMKYQNND